MGRSDRARARVAKLQLLQQTRIMPAILNELVIVPEEPESDQAQSLMNRMYQELTPWYGGTAEGRFPQLDFR